MEKQSPMELLGREHPGSDSDSPCNVEAVHVAHPHQILPSTDPQRNLVTGEWTHLLDAAATATDRISFTSHDASRNHLPSMGEDPAAEIARR